jgi:beta-phosphoglucomutase
MDHALAVIFDMDGVLVDSYQAHLKSWQQMAAEAGLAMSEEQFAHSFGRTSREIIAGLWGEGRLGDEEIARLDERKEQFFREIIAANFLPMPGAMELLVALYREGFALAVGSSGPPENVELVLARLQTGSLFEAVVTGRDISRGKPDPQVFLKAAARLRIPPERCAVVEDAPPGIEAAKAAEMTAIGLASTGRTRKELAAADMVVDSLAKLSPAIIEELILRKLE